MDSDDLVGPFLKQNPMLNETLQTKGKRGVNLWFRAEGEVPRVVKIDGFGELRGTGGQTVIKGKHPEGMSYRILNKASPVSLAIDDLKFPPPRNHSPESNSESNKVPMALPLSFKLVIILHLPSPQFMYRSYLHVEKPSPLDFKH